MNLSAQSACFIFWMKVMQFIVWAATKWPPRMFAQQHNGKAEAVNVEKRSYAKHVTLLLSSAALSSLSLAIIQLNSSQASAALAVRGRFLDARSEGELQRKLIERAMWVAGGMEETLTLMCGQHVEWELLYAEVWQMDLMKAATSNTYRKDKRQEKLSPVIVQAILERSERPFCVNKNVNLGDKWNWIRLQTLEERSARYKSMKVS